MESVIHLQKKSWEIAEKFIKLLGWIQLEKNETEKDLAPVFSLYFHLVKKNIKNRPTSVGFRFRVAKNNGFG